MESNSLGVIGWRRVSQKRPSGATAITGRAYHIGQKNPVFVHKLLCQDTAEERIHKLQQEKGKLAAGILADGPVLGFKYF